jgi:FtsP/CotA-like multicopper oxidase with cupredoxin domain
MASSRRELLRSGTAALTAAALGPSLGRAQEGLPATAPGSGPVPRPVVTPDGVTLEPRLSEGVKVYHLVAEPVDHEFAPGLSAHCFGYNGRVHGPTLEAVEGDRVRIYVTNRLDAPTSVHWHGFELPNGMDGVGGLTQRPILPGETFRYEFDLRRPGTFMYHSHHDEMTQMAMGLMGLFVVQPRPGAAPPPDRDYAFLLSEWKLEVGARRPDPNEMVDFNLLTLNGRAAPGTTPIVARVGERVRLRFGNLSAMSHHPIHLHGHAFQVVETDGGPVPEAARHPEVTVIVPVGSTRTVEFVASEPGDWALHCHMTHHVMTQMGHGLPNLIGLDPSRFDEALERAVPAYAAMGSGTGHRSQEGHDAPALVPPNQLAMVGTRGPFGTITMGGMFTLLKVRAELPEQGDVGWYAHPAGTVAGRASAAELARDGIEA